MSEVSICCDASCNLIITFVTGLSPEECQKSDKQRDQLRTFIKWLNLDSIINTQTEHFSFL